jgi:hypothetical protein
MIFLLYPVPDFRTSHRQLQGFIGLSLDSKWFSPDDKYRKSLPCENLELFSASALFNLEPSAKAQLFTAKTPSPLAPD